MAELTDAKFTHYVEKKVRDTIKKFELFPRDAKVGVAVSGGKDSTAVLYILKQLGYDVEAITIDAKIGNYTDENVKNIKQVCKENKVKLHIISFREEFGHSLCYIKSVLQSKGIKYSSCMICGILKRYLINKYSKEFKFDVIVTGHNLDDEAQAFMMNVFRNDIKLAVRQGPISGTKDDKAFVRRVKPLYHISEEEIIRYTKIKEFPINYGICPCSVGAFRRGFKDILDVYEKKNPSVKYNILHFHERMSALLDQEKLTKGKANRCEICGEPAAKEVCNACKIFEVLKLKK